VPIHASQSGDPHGLPPSPPENSIFARLLALLSFIEIVATWLTLAYLRGSIVGNESA
jgi:hypothetical protein